MNISSTMMNQSVDFSKHNELSKLKSQASDTEKVKEVAQEFESMFIEMMFKEMKKTLKNTSIAGVDAPGKDIFNDMLTTEYAKSTAKGQSFGLAKMIEDSLRPQIQPKV